MEQFFLEQKRLQEDLQEVFKLTKGLDRVGGNKLLNWWNGKEMPWNKVDWQKNQNIFMEQVLRTWGHVK